MRDNLSLSLLHVASLKYLFDWSIPLHCPELMKELIIPKYFSGDLLQQTLPGSLYQDSWPSLFISPAGITSDLHVDAFGSNFWMALFEGRKRYQTKSQLLHITIITIIDGSSFHQKTYPASIHSTICIPQMLSLV